MEKLSNKIEAVKKLRLQRVISQAECNAIIDMLEEMNKANIDDEDDEIPIHSVIWDTDSIRVYFCGVEWSEDFRDSIEIYFEIINKTSNAIKKFILYEVDVNDWMVDDGKLLVASNIAPYKKCKADACIFETSKYDNFKMKSDNTIHYGMAYLLDDGDSWESLKHFISFDEEGELIWN